MVFRYITPVTAVFTIMSVISKHPVIILFEGIGICRFSVYQNASIRKTYFLIFAHFLTFIDFYNSFVERKVIRGELYGFSFFRYVNGSIIVGIPFYFSILREYGAFFSGWSND